MFETLSNKLQETLQSLRGHKKISESNIESAVDEVRRALLESDVSLRAVKLFVDKVRSQALGAEVLTGVRPAEQFIKIINDELTSLLGGQSKAPELKKGDSVLLLGLQGAGKTSTAAKLAHYFKKQKLKVLLVPCDLQRPAAIKQLEILAAQAEADFLPVDDISGATGSEKLINIARKASDYARLNNIDIRIFDTAGRLQIDDALMAELSVLEREIKATEKLLVIDSLIGQEAANVAETFDKQIGISGIILTKLDGDSRGGAALSVVATTAKPIKLVAIGEQISDLENFYPERMASRILGMGDVVSLVEKAQAEIEEEEAKRLEAELMKGNFNYQTFVSAQNMISKLGSFSSVFGMLGMGGMLKQMGLDMNSQGALMEQGQKRLHKFKTIISSMTTAEKINPDLLANDSSSRSRKTRLARGSGMSETDVTQLVSEFNKMRQMFKNFGPMMQMMNGANAPDTSKARNPMDMISVMSSGLSKKQQKAMAAMGMGAKSSAPVKTIKKGTKPAIKGFGD